MIKTTRIGGVRKKLSKFTQQIFLLIKQLCHLAIHLRFGQSFGARPDAFSQILLLLLIGVQNFQKSFVLLRLQGKTILDLVHVRYGVIEFHWLALIARLLRLQDGVVCLGYVMQIIALTVDHVRIDWRRRTG